MASLSSARWAVSVLGLLGCGPGAAPAATDVAVPRPPSATAAPAETSPAAAASPRVLAADRPLEAGFVQFEGMVRPTKGGYEVRGVTLEASLLAEGFAGHAPAHGDADWLLGAKVRITGELVREGGEDEAPGAGGLAVQARSGVWFRMTRLARVELVKDAEVVEGVLARSKGMFSIGGHLVTSEDLGWSLPGKRDALDGLRVRLWGQSRVVVCDPNAQCLTTGSLPMFDIGRAQAVK
jgi:hypothetical protein